MSTPHVIRLRAPWELRLAADGSSTEVTPAPSPARKVECPGDRLDEVDPNFVGHARYTRRFNSPTNLESHERVWLVVAGLPHPASISLNDRPLPELPGDKPQHDFDITDQLCPHNTLAVDIRLPAKCSDRAQPPVEVRLEIRKQRD